jgi:hypothetical protein
VLSSKVCNSYPSKTRLRIPSVYHPLHSIREGLLERVRLMQAPVCAHIQQAAVMHRPSDCTPATLQTVTRSQTGHSICKHLSRNVPSSVTSISDVKLLQGRGTGWSVWDGSVVMARHIEALTRNGACLGPGAVLELGSSTGLAGLAAATCLKVCYTRLEAACPDHAHRPTLALEQHGISWTLLHCLLVEHTMATQIHVTRIPAGIPTSVTVFWSVW